MALGITAAAMVCDRLARRFQVDLRDTPASLRAIRNAIFIAAFALGCILPTLTDLLTRA